MDTNTITRRNADLYRQILAGGLTFVVPATFAGNGTIVTTALVGRVAGVEAFDDGALRITVRGKGIDGGPDAKAYVCQTMADAEDFMSTLVVI